jgi:hypothetical protein
MSMPMPPGQPSGPPAPIPPTGKRAWPRRHPVWSALIAGFALLVIIGAATNGTGSTKASSATAAASPRPAITPTPHVSLLTCDAQAVSERPADHTIVRIRVRTLAHARVTATGPLAWVRGERATGRASAGGTRMLRFRVGDAPPGVAVVITVRVSHAGKSGSCQAALRPRPAQVAAVAVPAQPTAPPSPAPAPLPTTAASCHPLSDEGTCYEPGEFCRDSDHGVTGVAGDGETIRCEDNDGWRWEPV